MQTHEFLWHDYEAFGANPRRDRPAQFAAIRTDAELNEIGVAINIFCRPSLDILPEPEACLITGITPQQCWQQGLPEYQFAAQIEAAFSQSGTIGVGYNSLRYDDEMTRFLFWRNLIDPYAREWQNQCGRWDILDLLRTAHALRPEGINWPKNEAGLTSFRLEHLTAANGLSHQHAHDALSDVRATIGLARLVKQLQPRLFDFCLGLRKKERVLEELCLHDKRPVLHITGMYPVEQGCLSLIWPLAVHPGNRNEVIVWDLRHDPRELAQLDSDTVRQRLFTRQAELPEGVSRLPIKTLHINRSPIVISQLKTLSPAQAQAWQLDLAQIQRHADYAAALPDLSALWQTVYQQSSEPQTDVDQDLYGGFINPADRRLLNELRQLEPQQLASAQPAFTDERLAELVWRYRARNFPETLNDEEQQRWQALRQQRLMEGADGYLAVDAFQEKIDSLGQHYEDDERAQEILGALYDYAEQLLALE